MKHANRVVICPPCGENVGLPTKRGANKVMPILPLLPRLTAVLPPQGREITTRGFTLIELLVVVLIISILAAIALPQYKLATTKSKVSTFLPTLRAFYQAGEAYYLANGNYTLDARELDINIPSKCTMIPDRGGQLWQCGNEFIIDNSIADINVNFCPNNNDFWSTCKSTRDFTLGIVRNHQPETPTHTEMGGSIWCKVQHESALGQKICNSFQNL